MEGSNFIMGIGPMFMFMVVYAVFLIVRVVVLKCPKSGNRHISRVQNVFFDHRVEPTIIRFILEGGLDILSWSLIALINAKKNTFGKKRQDAFSNVFAACMLVALLYAIVHTLIRAKQLQKHLQIDADKLENDAKKKHEEKQD